MFKLDIINSFFYILSIRKELDSFIKNTGIMKDYTVVGELKINTVLLDKLYQPTLAFSTG